MTNKFTLSNELSPKFKQDIQNRKELIEFCFKNNGKTILFTDSLK